MGRRYRKIEKTVKKYKKLREQAKVPSFAIDDSGSIDGDEYYDEVENIKNSLIEENVFEHKAFKAPISSFVTDEFDKLPEQIQQILTENHADIFESNLLLWFNEL